MFSAKRGEKVAVVCVCVCVQALPSPTEWMEAGERFYHIVMLAKDCKCMKVKQRSCGLLLSSLRRMTQEEGNVEH